MLTIDGSICTLCQVCVQACPFEALRFDGEKVVVLENCRLCRICIKHCPEGAISLRLPEDSEVEGLNTGGILVVAETNGQQLHPVTFELLGKGREMADKTGQELSCVLVGCGVDGVANELLEYGVNTCFFYDNSAFEHYRVEPFVNALVDVVQKVQPSIVLVAATPTGRSLAPRIATRLRTGLTADCTTLDIRENGELVQIRPAFGGNVMAQIITPRHRPQMATVRYKVMEPAIRRIEKGARIEKCSLPPEQLESSITVLSFERKHLAQDLADAEFVVVAGRGIRSDADLVMIKDLAHILGAQLGATRPLIEAGWVDYSRQIGLSGRVIRPRLLLAIGVSGAVQFTAGISGAEHIVAINDDPEAPIMKLAHYGLVGDLYSIVPYLISTLRGGTTHDLLQGHTG